MPTVPYQAYPTVPTIPTPTGPLPERQDIRVSPEMFGEQVGHSMIALQGNLAKSAEEFNQLALERQDLHNKVTADNAVNNYNDDLTRKETAFYALHGQDAINAFPGFRQGLVDSRNAMRAQLQNQYQQLAFDAETRRMQAYAMQRAGTHYDQQYDVFQSATNKATAGLADQAMDSHFDDPAAFNEALARRISADYSELKRQGLANNPDNVYRMMQQARSDAVDRQLKGYMGRNEISTVAAILNRESGPDGALTREDMFRWRGVLSEANVGAAVDRAMGRSRPAASGGDTTGDLWTRIKAQEAGVGPGGEARVSPAGAVGISQILPSTAKTVAAELGVPYDEERLHTDQAYNEMLGRRYLQDMLDRYDGSPVLASAAYNAGPQRVDEWIAKYGDPRSGAISAADWAAKIPINETKGYVAKVAAPGTTAVAQPIPTGAEQPAAGQPIYTRGQRTLMSLPDYMAAHDRLMNDPTLDEVTRPKALAALKAEIGAELQINNAIDSNARNMLIDWQTKNEADLYAQAMTGQPIDQNKMAWMVKNQLITVGGYNAVRAELARMGRGTDNVDVFNDLDRRARAGEDISADLNAAVERGDIKGTTALGLLRTNDSRNQKRDDHVLNNNFSSLRTIAGMDDQNHPMFALSKDEAQKQAALWFQAQNEWNQRVWQKGEDSTNVLADMAPRYTNNPGSLAQVIGRQPKFGTVTKLADLSDIKAATIAAHERGELSDDQFMAEGRLLAQYKLGLEAQQQREDAFNMVPKTPAGQRPGAAGGPPAPAPTGGAQGRVRMPATPAPPAPPTSQPLPLGPVPGVTISPGAFE